MNFSIIPGAVVPDPDVEIAEIQQNYMRKQIILPEQGGVGSIPLPIVHQGMLPICTGVATANARMILHYQQTGKIVPFSGLFIYKMNRLFDGLPKEMKGSTLEASMQTLQYKGVCRENLYPSTKKNCNRAFPADGSFLIKNAVQYRIQKYERCENLEEILEALAEQHPVVFSMVIYTDFYQAQRGIVSAKKSGQRIGGHSMVAINYDLQQELLQVVQSWGRATNGPTEHGYMYIPFSWFQLQDEETDHNLLIEAFALLD